MRRLMIFAKAPEPGRVKTRTQLPPEQAAMLHTAFVRDVVARHRREDRETTLWVGSPHPLWAELGVPTRAQPSGDLGHRMTVAFEETLEGDARVVILGTDSPSLPPRLVDAAFEALEEVPVVIGPACDGGYYLLGLRGGVPPIFEGPEWGGSEVLASTLDLLDRPYRLLEFWYDVDRPADLRLLRAHMTALGEDAPEHSRKALERL